MGQVLTSFCRKVLRNYRWSRVLIFLPVLGVSQVCLMYLHRQYAFVSFCYFGLRKIHHSYFFKCLNEGTDPMRSKYRYSFFAIQQIASSMVAQSKFWPPTSLYRLLYGPLKRKFIVRHLYSKNAALTTRLFFLWLHVLSALVVLAAIVIRAPGCEAAQGAMLDLDLGLMVFNEASDSRRVKRALVCPIPLVLFHHLTNVSADRAQAPR